MTLNKCPVCNSTSLYLFLSKNNIPTNENLIFDNEDDAQKISRGNLNSVLCINCDFVFNQTFDFSLMNYGDGYENSQNSSPFFKNHVNNLINNLIEKHHISNSKILEIGCGNGYFLKELVKNNSLKNFGIGYDPSYSDSKTNFENLRFEKKFFDSSCYEDADVIISRHVIEHIPNPINFLKNIRKISKPHSKIFIETPTVKWILENNIFWDFTYEHCSFFSMNSLTTAFQITGFRVDSVRNIFENQYLILEATPTNNITVTKNSSLLRYAKLFRFSSKAIENALKSKIQTFKKSGNVAIWGAAGKGVCLTNILDPDHDIIECLIDLNPKKWNKFISGTGHEIINFTEIENRNIKTVFVMNPNYFDEIKTILSEHKICVNLISSQ